MRFPFTGVIPVDKPVGVSSRGVVDAVVRGLRMKAVGHAGTLDPLASGVVVVCVGHATKLVEHVHELVKRYRATFLLGRSSPSDDLETPVDEEVEPVRPTADELEAAAAAFRGDILQRPCDYSAVHVGGQRAYRLARKGRALVLEPKPVRIDRFEITAYQWPRLDVEIECSSGTFVRALGRDLAAAVGTKAVMAALERTAVGPFTIESAIALASIDPVTLAERLLPAVAAVAHLPRHVFDDESLADAVRGGLVSLEPPGAAAAAVAALDAAGELVGILRRLDGPGDERVRAGTHRLRPNFRGEG